MKMRLFTSVVAALVIAAFAVSLHAQGGAKTEEAPKPTPRTVDGHPDLSGVWVAGNRGIPCRVRMRCTDEMAISI